MSDTQTTATFTVKASDWLLLLPLADSNGIDAGDTVEVGRHQFTVVKWDPAGIWVRPLPVTYPVGEAVKLVAKNIFT